jgi:hypothetical protein
MARSVRLLAPWSDTEGTLFAAGREVVVGETEYWELRGSGRAADEPLGAMVQDDEHGPTQGTFTVPYTDLDGCLFAAGSPATISPEEAAVLRTEGKLDYAEPEEPDAPEEGP